MQEESKTANEPKIRRSSAGGDHIPSDEFLKGQIAQCKSIIKICEREHFQVNGRRKNTDVLDNQVENYISGRQKAYTALIAFLTNQIKSYEKTLEYKVQYGSILEAAGVIKHVQN